MHLTFYKKGEGFTLIELLIVIGIIVILAAVVIVAINPRRQFAMANNSRRWANINAVLNAVSQNIIDNKGVWTCTVGVLPAVAATMASTVGAGVYNICSCLVPTYIGELPVDPIGGSYTSCAIYNTNYRISQDATSGRVTVSAPNAQSEDGTTPTISVTR